MKLNAALAKSLLMAASIGMVVPVLADTTVVKTSPDTATPPAKPDTSKPAPAKPLVKPAATNASTAKPTDPKPAPAKPTKPAAPAVAKKKDPAEIELPGIVQPRGSGGYLTVEVDGGKFKVSFYDKEKTAINADVVRAVARWDSNKKIHQDRAVLNLADDGKALRGNEFVSPPYTFKLFLTLLDSEGKAVENYVVQMKP